METLEVNSAEQQEKAAKDSAKVIMIWVATVSITMLFAALCSAFFVSKGGNFWVQIQMPKAFWMSTGVILLSSLALYAAYSAYKSDRTSFGNSMLALTLVLGLIFSGLQFVGYKQLMEKGNYFIGNIMTPNEDGFFLKGEYGKDFTISFNGMILNYEKGKLFFPDGTELTEVQYQDLKNSRNTASSYIYIITFLHLLHLIGGLLYLIYVTTVAYAQKRFNSGNYLKIKLISVYWHFLGALWVILFLFLQFIH